MSKSLMLILTMAMLVWSLTACGCTAKQAGEQAQNSGNGQTDSAIVDDNAANKDNQGESANGNHNGTGSLTEDIRDTVTDGVNDMTNAVEDAGDALTGNNTMTDNTLSGTDGVSYEQMLRNARVHDRDGDLTDHENSVSRGSMF